MQHSENSEIQRTTIIFKFLTQHFGNHSFCILSTTLYSPLVNSPII
jgi:hypothetical protein